MNAEKPTSAPCSGFPRGATPQQALEHNVSDFALSHISRSHGCDYNMCLLQR